MPSYINTEAIARELDSVQRMPTEHLMTGWFSGMDQAVLRLLEAYPQLRPAHSRFSQARQGIWPRQLTDVTWNEMEGAASELAVAVRALGNIDIELCERPTKYSSECGHALMPDSSCALDWHTHDRETPGAGPVAQDWRQPIEEGRGYAVTRALNTSNGRVYEITSPGGEPAGVVIDRPDSTRVYLDRHGMELAVGLRPPYDDAVKAHVQEPADPTIESGPGRALGPHVSQIEQAHDANGQRTPGGSLEFPKPVDLSRADRAGAGRRAIPTVRAGQPLPATRARPYIAEADMPIGTIARRQVGRRRHRRIRHGEGGQRRPAGSTRLSRPRQTARHASSVTTRGTRTPGSNCRAVQSTTISRPPGSAGGRTAV